MPEVGFAFTTVLVSTYSHAATVLSQPYLRIESSKLGKRLLVESFASMGCNESEALKHAYVIFFSASLYVVLATLWIQGMANIRLNGIPGIYETESESKGILHDKRP